MEIVTYVKEKNFIGVILHDIYGRPIGSYNLFISGPSRNEIVCINGTPKNPLR